MNTHQGFIESIDKSIIQVLLLYQTDAHEALALQWLDPCMYSPPCELQEAIVTLETPKASKQLMYHITQPGILFYRPM